MSGIGGKIGFVSYFLFFGWKCSWNVGGNMGRVRYELLAGFKVKGVRCGGISGLSGEIVT